jgi:SAM-dependent methyltransferase
MNAQIPFQYQTFDDAEGMVDSRAKLEAFAIPPMSGKSFLDIGCNEGYYCGYALVNGARRVVGIDGNKPFIEAAKRRFPAVEFIHSDWSKLPDEKFDVVLHASCIHYISSVDATIAHLKNIAKCVATHGTLILELGVHTGPDRNLVTVERHDGSKVYYPTWVMLMSMLNRAGLVPRYKGLSEPGDAIPRRVFHCSVRQPEVLVLLGKPNSGKTTAGVALTRDERRIVNVDAVMLNAFRARFPADMSKFREDLGDFNGMDQFYLKHPDTAPSIIAGIIAASVKSVAINPDGEPPISATVVDGFDITHPQHMAAYSALKQNLLIEGYRLWSARRELV